MKNCRICQKILNSENWAPSLEKKNNRICKECHLEKNRQWRAANPTKSNEYAKASYEKNKSEFHARVTKHRRKLRLETIKEYGGKCVRCGISDTDVLDLDHIYNDGADDRRNNLFAYNLYRHLKKNGYPKDRHQLLCKNCNWKKELERRRVQ